MIEPYFTRERQLVLLISTDTSGSSFKGYMDAAIKARDDDRVAFFLQLRPPSSLTPAHGRSLLDGAWHLGQNGKAQSIPAVVGAYFDVNAAARYWNNKKINQEAAAGLITFVERMPSMLEKERIYHTAAQHSTPGSVGEAMLAGAFASHVEERYARPDRLAAFFDTARFAVRGSALEREGAQGFVRNLEKEEDPLLREQGRTYVLNAMPRNRLLPKMLLTQPLIPQRPHASARSSSADNNHSGPKT